MATHATDKFIEQLRRAVLCGGDQTVTDARLLGRYAEQRDEAAFAALVRRHGPMVWGVCRRILANAHDAEDAFQATFLVLVRKAPSLRPREMVGNWLYGVAHQTAIRARAQNAKRQSREKQVTTMPDLQAAVPNGPGDWQGVLDLELSRLPDKYRVAIVLCDLEGKSRADAARQLGWPEGSLSGRLARGRALLAKRLAKYGAPLSVAALAAELSRHAASASLPAALVSSTIKAASLLAAGQLAASVVSVRAAALMEGVVKAMFLTKLKGTTALVLAVGLVTGGVGGVSQPTVARVQAQNQKDAESKKASGPDEDARAVAFIHGNVPITRAELADYLIERFGAERLEFVVNRKILEMACKAKGIVVSDLEVEQHFKQDVAALGPHATPKLFYEQILKPNRKTIFEYKEDVIRQRLAMNKLVDAELQQSITNADLLKTFEVLYGPKVQCRMIVYKEMGLATKAWGRLRDSQNIEAAFIAEAKQQPVVELAARGGELDKPIHKHFGDGIGAGGGSGARIEKEAFSLKPGEMSQVIGMPDNTAIILFCQKHIPADSTKNFDNERLALLNATRQHKLGELTSQKLRQLRQEAAPRYLLPRSIAD